MGKKSVYVVIAVVLAGVGAFVWNLNSSGKLETVSVTVPSLSALAVTGKKAFDGNCKACHGVNGAGSDKGPPLVHDIYNPGHHGDQSFLRAAKRGVRQHHWAFGNMPPVPGVNERDVAAIIRYVRELQLGNGITYRAHRM